MLLCGRGGSTCLERSSGLFPPQETIFGLILDNFQPTESIVGSWPGWSGSSELQARLYSMKQHWLHLEMTSGGFRMGMLCSSRLSWISYWLSRWSYSGGPAPGLDLGVWGGDGTGFFCNDSLPFSVACYVDLVIRIWVSLSSYLTSI